MKKFLFIILAACLTLCASAQVDRTKAPAPGPAPKVHIGESQSFTLKNGLKVLVVENHQLPRITFNLMVMRDELIEGEKAGYTEVFGELWGKATNKRNNKQLGEDVDFIGAHMSTGAKSASIYGLSKHTAEMMEIFADIVLNPAFPQEEFDKLILQTQSALKANATSPGTILSNIMQTTMYGSEHPYGEVMTEKTLLNVTLEDCKEYYGNYIFPNNSVLVIVGDITLKNAKKLVNTHFSKWAKGEAPKFKYNIPAQPKGNQVVFSNKNGANQASISVTYPIDFQKGQPDELAVEVMNQILGGGSFQAKLFKNLRETKGYTYGAYSSIYPDLLAGSARFSASSEVKAGVVDSALIEIFKEMNNMIEGNFSDEDLSRVKSTAAGDFSRSLESPNTVATFAYVIERYNLPADYFTTYLERLSKVSREDVIAAAKKYLHPNNAYVFVVTDRSQKEKLNKLASNGKVTEVENDGGPMKEGPKVAEGVTTETVVDAYLKAIGGKEKIANIKDMTLTSAMDMSGMSITTTTQYLTTPGKPAFKMEVSMGGNVIQKMVFDGTVAIVSGQRLEGENAAEIKKLAYPILEVEYLNLGAVLDGIEMVNGRNAYKLKVDNGKTTIYSFYDVENGLKVKDVNVAGDKIQEQLMEDYRETEVGILFPYVYKTTMMGMPIETKVSEIKFNTGLKIEDFK